jgi:hypothetical protein
MVRERIARRCGVPVNRLTPQTHLIRDLHADGASLGFLVALLESSMDVKLLPTLKKMQREFRVGADGRLTPAAWEQIQLLLPGLDADGARAAAFDDLWTVAMIESLVAKALSDRPVGHSSESIWDWQQQGWLQRLPGELGARKVRLLLAACCRSAFQPRKDLEPEVVRALEALECFADTGKSKTALREAQRGLEQWRLDRVAELKALHMALSATAPEAALATACNAMHHALQISQGQALQRFRAFHRDLGPALKDPAEFAAVWRTPTVIDLAGMMYEARDFHQMPRLAEALAEAGCRHQEVLAHARDHGAAHIRGCWLVDAILDGSWATPPTAAKPRAKNKRQRDA